MKDVIAFLILLPFLCLMGKVIGRFYYRLGAGLCRAIRPANQTDTGRWHHDGGLPVRSGAHHSSGRDS